METVTLTSSDGQSFETQVQSVTMSETIKNLIEDAGIENDIPLPNVTGSVLERIIKYCDYHTKNPEPKAEGTDEKRTDDIIPWDVDFCKVDQATLFELILAANYLDIKCLLEVTCKTVANLIKGKTPKEIRQLFNIKNDFTPEEEAQVRKENEWCEER